MMSVDEPTSPSVLTLVLRLSKVDAYHDKGALQFQVTQVHTGEVLYFRSIESVAHHVEQLARTLIKPPIDLIEFRQRSDNV